METAKLFDLFNTLSPLGLSVMLGYIIYLLVSKTGPVKQIGHNHLHDLPGMAATLARVETVLEEIKRGITGLRGVWMM